MRKVFLKVMCITMLSLVMSITMLSSVSAKEASIEYQGVWTDYAAKKYAAGDGTKESPYLIKDASELALLAKNVNHKEEKNKYYELISDIDLSGHFWNPIGYVIRELNVFYGGNYFYGVFEGNNHTIKNLNIVQSNPDKDNYYYGLFAWNSGTIQNLNIINANIDCDGVSYIGGIASVNEGNINQCSFDGSVSVSNDVGDIAGIVGRQVNGGTVKHCKNKAQIKATTQDCDYLGGIVGFNEYGFIRDCVNEGEIIGNSQIGGIAGENDGFNGHSYIERCINLGNIKGNEIIGGIAGENYRTASIINCENIGHITGNEYAGGISGAAGVLEKDKKEIKYCINIGKIECDSYGNAIVGALYAGSSECAISLKNCYYLETSAKVGYEEYDIPGNYEISEIKALSTLKELVQQEIYKDFDFTNVWKISKYYPVVKNLDFDESLLEKPNVHEHSYDILKYDETGHWKECLCGDKTEKQQHILEVRNQKQATCTEDGYSGDQYCKDCGLKVKSGSKLKALGHVWDTGTITKEATCTEKGEKKHKCTNKGCDEIWVEEIPALGHDYKDGVCTRCHNQLKGQWKQSGNKWWYQYEDGTYPKNEFITIDNKLYRFDQYGYMQTGWFKVNNEDYYATSSGEIKAQWVGSGNTWYYVDADGKMVTGFQTISGTKYYFETNGLMKKGWFKVNGTDYYASTSGEIKAQWVGSGNTWYYVDADGKMVTGYQTIAGAKYYFANSGLMQTGWFKINGADYYATSSGAIKAQWVGSGNTWYYVDADGKMVTGYQTIAGAKYYFAESGLMQTGWFKINGEDYYAASSGVISAQWVGSGNTWYYVDAEGKMVTGDYVIDERVNHFDANGVWNN